MRKMCAGEKKKNISVRKKKCDDALKYEVCLAFQTIFFNLLLLQLQSTKQVDDSQ